MNHRESSDRFRRKAIQVDEAQQKINEWIRNGVMEDIRLEDSFGRRLAKNITATHNMPHFRRSGMDGFAIQAESTAGVSSDRPVVLEVIENIPCGSTPARVITRACASRIMTGAMVPEGADTVVMLEMTESFEQDGKKYVSIQKELKPNLNVTPIGLELMEGDDVLESGRRLGAGEVALLATFGHGIVPVYKRPQVAIFATGSELLSIDEPLQPGKIRNSNTYMLAAQVWDAGGTPILMGSIPDEIDLAKDKISEAYSIADFVITTGGVSVGDYDIMADLFKNWQGTMLFNKVTMRPGSPTTVGVWKDKLLFALSGNPGACFVGFELFVRPVIDGMQGGKDCFPKETTAFISEDFTKVNAYPRFVRGISYTVEGKVYVRQAGLDQSSSTISIRDSDCLIVIPPGGRGLLAGKLVKIIKLRESQRGYVVG
ncbi:MAG: molybdopterin molybdenumtransferase MoeA [Paenibacillus sp.]|jgi:molybdopterin molybdotransferase|nr:molybdopterin molybdenumtransferase MoeA [Paenibacillus sp.]